MPEPRKFPRDLYKKIGDAGFIGYAMPKELGGQGKSKLEYITLIEELCYHDAAIGLLCAVAELATYPIVHFASDEQKKKWVPKCASGEIIPAFVLTEPEAGSDVSAIETTAEARESSFVINGRKRFISNGYSADMAVLFARTIVEGEPAGLSAFVVEKGTKGWEVAWRMELITSHDIVEFRIVNLEVPRQNLLGEIAGGFKLAMQTLDLMRMSVGAAAVGMAKAAMEQSLSHARSRKQFGRPIAQFQAVSFKLADMATETEAARALVYLAAIKRDRGEPDASLHSSMAKMFATEAAWRCIDQAVQIHGGMGLVKGSAEDL